MQRRIFHGELKPADMARALVAHFNRGNLVAQQIGNGEKFVVQIATRQRPTSGGQTALSVMILAIEEGVAVQLSKQNWMGIAASLGVTAMSAWRNPFSLLGRLDDLAQDFENLQLSEEIWQVVENVARLRGASFELSERLRSVACAYCLTANPVGAPHCIACGAPLGERQPATCASCGYITKQGEEVCPNCGKQV
jgi:hypothetical protein